MSLVQAEADDLFRMVKQPRSAANLHVEITASIDRREIELVSIDGRELFILDIGRTGVVEFKYKLQKRARRNIVLRRLDWIGSPHTNPEVDNLPSGINDAMNGVEVACPHIHIYIEGWGDKWAVPAHVEIGNEIEIISASNAFINYLNINNTTFFRGGLFE